MIECHDNLTKCCHPTYTILRNQVPTHFIDVEQLYTSSKNDTAGSRIQESRF